MTHIVDALRVSLVQFNAVIAAARDAGCTVTIGTAIDDLASLTVSTPHGKTIVLQPVRKGAS